MANTFYPFPTVGGSNNTWGTSLNVLLRAGGEGALSAELYNDAGTLKLSKGDIGIYDGVVHGISVIDTITTISTAGMTANNWHKVEMSVSGSSVTLTIAAIAGATDESTIDATTKAAYDYTKQGYYLAATKRLLGVVYLRTALALGRIVNCESGKLGFKGITIGEHYDTAGVLTKSYLTKMVIEIGDWNMDTTVFILVNYPFAILQAIRNAKVVIRDDGGTVVDLLDKFGPDLTDPLLVVGGLYVTYNAGHAVLYRRTGGSFDGVNYDSIGYNRGWLTIEYET
jgi:hypothetical protein